MPERPSSRETKREMDLFLQQFAEVSGASPDVVEQTKKLFSGVVLPEDSLEAAKSIRQHLIDKKFEYDDEVFCLQDMLNKKRGNCLGLSLLFGAILDSRGNKVGYETITHPKDAIDKQDNKLFSELLAGEHFDYDNPQLPALKDVPAFPIYRFVPLEHAALILDGKRFETTGLEDGEEDPQWMPEAELIQPATFPQVASNVYIDRVKIMLRRDNWDKPEQLKELVVKALKMHPDNREAWHLLWQIAHEMNDDTLKQKACERYTTIGGDDSRFHQEMYEMTKDESYLDKTLEKFPANIVPFTEKHVTLEKDPQEAKFNVAVAAWCVANSSALDLKKFYLTHEQKIRELYGEKTWKKIIREPQKR